ncbi:MAG: Fe-S cluster assembly protein SufB [Patescibacteria group bacterium]
MADSKIQEILETSYSAGFSSDIDQDVFAKGLNEDTIHRISYLKSEPEWLLNWRLKAYHNWLKMPEPHWAKISYKPIDYQNISYFAKPKKQLNSLDELDPEIIATFNKLGIPIQEQKQLANVAVDVVLDSVSVKTTFENKLKDMGIVFCPISKAIQEHPDLVKQYLGSIVPPTDNFFACLNSAVFSDGTFVFIPANTRCPIELSTYFRINAVGTGQFERTLIICEDNSYVSYLEGCTAPQRDENQLHAAVVELIAHKNSEIKYATVQNWYPGDRNGNGGIYNFVTKRGLCKGNKSKISWTQMETGSAITWKYPSVILKGDNSRGEFYSIAITKNQQQADTGTKMTHIGKNTKSRIISKGISAGSSRNTYRGLIKVSEGAQNTQNYTRCDSLILSQNCEVNTFPKIESSNKTAKLEHEASTTKISEDILNYVLSKGLEEEEASNLIIHGYSREILQRLPLEFAIEAKALLEISMEGAVG